MLENVYLRDMRGNAENYFSFSLFLKQKRFGENCVTFGAVNIFSIRTMHTNTTPTGACLSTLPEFLSYNESRTTIAQTLHKLPIVWDGQQT